MHKVLILLAAGGSRRYGYENKLLEPIHGKAMYRYILDRLLACRDEETDILVVTNADEIREFCEMHNIAWIENDCWEEGIASSIRAAVSIIQDYDGCAFFVADQPNLSLSAIREFLELIRSDEIRIASMTDGSHWGNPGWFRAEFYPELMSLQGDTGGKVIMRRYLEKVYRMSVEKGELYDIDVKMLDIDEMVRYNN